MERSSVLKFFLAYRLCLRISLMAYKSSSARTRSAKREIERCFVRPLCLKIGFYLFGRREGKKSNVSLLPMDEVETNEED